MYLQKYLFLILLLPAFIYSSDKAFDGHKYIEHIQGDLPIIISAPHGGRIKDKAIPDRTKGVLRSDLNTDKLAMQVYEAFKKKGKTPHLVICHLHRIKVDCNRSKEECSDGDPKAIAVWQAFQDSI